MRRDVSMLDSSFTILTIFTLILIVIGLGKALGAVRRNGKEIIIDA